MAMQNGVMFVASDFFQQPDVVENRFWLGGLVLVRRAQIENEEFWVENRISFAISFDSGPSKDADTAEYEGWYRYPFGRKALNIPIMSPTGMAQRTRSYLPYIVGALAAGRNVALHAANDERAFLGLMVLVLALAPPGASAEELLPTSIMLVISEKSDSDSMLLQEYLAVTAEKRSAAVARLAAHCRAPSFLWNSSIPCREPGCQRTRSSTG